MPRAHTLDLRYEHCVRAALAQPEMHCEAPLPAFAEGRDLQARLRCLKALMDAERDGIDVCSLAAAARTFHA